uniref:Uncharacterized protein n=1 Tax=Trypanosoma congolense (strain IL3000) TaxID=1068625 RepID=F9WIQ0_TRYCI|nr:hypothetical protein, unlikely [Trypanosoma congolense IL3000]
MLDISFIFAASLSFPEDIAKRLQNEFYWFFVVKRLLFYHGVQGLDTVLLLLRPLADMIIASFFFLLLCRFPFSFVCRYIFLVFFLFVRRHMLLFLSLLVECNIFLCFSFSIYGVARYNVRRLSPHCSTNYGCYCFFSSYAL